MGVSVGCGNRSDAGIVSSTLIVGSIYWHNSVYIITAKHESSSTMKFILPM
jgi:hypothetical protein